MKKLTVTGAGTMGNGITQVCVSFEHRVCMEDIYDEVLKNGIKAIESSLSRLQKRGKLSEL